MSTFLEMQNRIADDLNRSDLTVQIKKAINRAIRYYEKEPFWFKETEDTFTTVANQKDYDFTDTGISNILRIHYVEADVNGGLQEVIERDIRWIESRNPNNSTGTPTDYAWWENKFWLSLVPNDTYDITVYYTKSYADLSADANTNDWTTYAEDLIEARARWWLFIRLQGTSGFADPTKATSAKQEELDALQALREKNEGFVAQGRIPPTCF